MSGRVGAINTNATTTPSHTPSGIAAITLLVVHKREVRLSTMVNAKAIATVYGTGEVRYTISKSAEMAAKMASHT